MYGFQMDVDMDVDMGLECHLLLLSFGNNIKSPYM